MAPQATEQTQLVFGQCTMDSHEGSPATNAKGQHFQECPGTVKSDMSSKVFACACWCHAVVAKARELLEEFPDRTPPAGHVVDDDAPLQEVADQLTLANKEITLIRAPVQPPTFGPTASGRKAKGQLEQEVLEACDAWLKLGATGQCTAVFIASWIDSNDPPSTGAITAVLERWKDMGFGFMEKGPIRFTGYTDEGNRLGLYAFKEKHRRMAKTQSRRIQRGF